MCSSTKLLEYSYALQATQQQHNVTTQWRVKLLLAGWVSSKTPLQCKRLLPYFPITCQRSMNQSAKMAISLAFPKLGKNY